MNEGRKLAILEVTPELITELCKSGGKQVTEVIANALPVDARVYAIGVRPPWFFDIDRGTMAILLTSGTFAEVANGAVAPVLPVPIFRGIFRSATRSLVCLECGATLEDKREEEIKALICSNSECGVIIPARAWREF